MPRGASSRPPPLTVGNAAGLITIAPCEPNGQRRRRRQAHCRRWQRPAYQWKFNGRAIKGATTAALTLPNGVTAGGDYSVTLSNATGLVAASAARLNDPHGRSAHQHRHARACGRRRRGASSAASSRAATAPRKSSRAPWAPRWHFHGVTGALPRPSSRSTAAARPSTPTAWAVPRRFATVFTQVGAFLAAHRPADLRHPGQPPRATTAPPSPRPAGQGGVALIELYDADTGTPVAELINISTRALVGGEAGQHPHRRLRHRRHHLRHRADPWRRPEPRHPLHSRRALGPSHVAVYDSAGVEVAVNSIWGRGGRGDDDDDRDADREDDIDDASDRWAPGAAARLDGLRAAPHAPSPSLSVHITGVGNRSGIALAEVFEVR